MFVLSAPSGTGKTTLSKRLVGQVPELVLGGSHTTRAPRPGERDGVDYFFVDDAAFERMRLEGGLLECARIFGHRYGLSLAWVERQRASGKDLLLDVNPDGAQRVRQAKSELARFPEYDYLVVNETLDQASRELEAIILARRALLGNREALARRILAGF